MTLQRFIKVSLTAWMLQFASSQVIAAEHNCAMHCQSHTDKGASMCVEHCKTGKPADHACADHCVSQAQDDKDQMCATHCSKT